MTDHELEQRLRAWYRAEVGDEAAPTTLRDSLADVTDVAPRAQPFDRRTLVLLAAAAMLAVAAIGSALAIGSGLIDLPWREDSSLSPIYGAGWCDPALADGVVLTFQSDERPTVSDLPRYVVYEDRRVLRLDSSATAVDLPFGVHRKGWSQRHLTPESLEQLLGSARAIDGSGCEAIYIGDTGYQEYALTTRTGDGVAQVMFGTGLFQTGASDPAKVAAATDLARQFAEPDLGLSPSGWTDSVWLPWVAERYIVTTVMYSDGGIPSSAAWDVELPDGSTPRTFGETVPGLEDAGIAVWRCGIVNGGEIDGIVAAFDAAATAVKFFVPETYGYLDFADGGHFSIEAALPDETDCQVRARALGMPLAPQHIAVPDPEVADVSACDLVEGDPFWKDEPDYGPGGWAACYQITGFDQVYSRMKPTSAAQALELVRLEFGDNGYVSDSIGGRTVYLNECLHSSIPCAPAIAISADPYFVIVRATRTFPEPVPTPPYEERLREMAAVVIHNLED
jgi:hypothetical protein